MGELRKLIDDLDSLENALIFYKHKKEAKTIRDAIERLEGQHKPRVLSKREAYDLPDETDVWCEHRDSGRVFAMTTIGKKFFMYRPTFAMGLESNDIRFWTARPTEEQRKAVPWETH